MQQDKDLTNALMENKKVDSEIRKKQDDGEIDLNDNPIEDEQFIEKKIKEVQKELEYWRAKKNQMSSNQNTQSEDFPDIKFITHTRTKFQR